MLLLATLLTANPALAGHEHSSSRHVRPASQGSVLIDNTTRKTLSIWSDGQFLAAVGSGRTVVRLPEGRVDLVARADDRVVDRISASVRSDRQVSWTVEKPATGILRVENPLPIDVFVELPDGRSRRVEANGSISWAGMDLGDCQITFRRTDGALLQRKQVHIGAWEATRVKVKKPSTGIVLVQNDLPYAVVVYVDGRKKVTLGAYESRQIHLAPGQVRVDLVDGRGHGGRIESAQVDVDRYRTSTVSTGTPRVASSSCHMRPR